VRGQPWRGGSWRDHDDGGGATAGMVGVRRLDRVGTKEAGDGERVAGGGHRGIREDTNGRGRARRRGSDAVLAVFAVWGRGTASSAAADGLAARAVSVRRWRRPVPARRRIEGRLLRRC